MIVTVIKVGYRSKIISRWSIHHRKGKFLSSGLDFFEVSAGDFCLWSRFKVSVDHGHIDFVAIT